MPVFGPNSSKQITPSSDPTGKRRASRRKTQMVNRKGVARFDDLITTRILEQTPQISLPLNTVKDQVVNTEWDVNPTVENPGVAHNMQADNLYDFFDGGFNANNESFDYLLKLWVNDLLSIDTGVLELVPTATKIDDNYWLSELYALDGSVMSKELTPKDTVPQPPDPAFWKYGNRPQINADWLDDGALEDLASRARLQRYTGRSQNPVPYSRDEIVWVEDNPRPRDTSAYGFGLVQQAQDWATILLNQDTANKRHFSEDEYSKGILQIATNNQDELDAFRSYWKEEVKGDTDTKLPIVGGGGEQGDTEFIPFTETLKELQYLESQEWYTKLIAMLFGLNESELGFSGDTNLATAKEHQIQVWRQTTRPILTTLENAINNQILPKTREYDLADGELRFEFDKSHPAVEEAEAEQRRNDLDRGVTTVNEIRETEGKEPLEWGDMPSEAMAALVREHPEWAAENWGGIDDAPEPTSDAGGLFGSTPDTTDDKMPSEAYNEIPAQEDTEGQEDFSDGRALTLGAALETTRHSPDPEDTANAHEFPYVKDEPMRNERTDFPDISQYVDEGTEKLAAVIAQIPEQIESDLEQTWPDETDGMSPDQRKALGIDIDTITERINIREGLVSAITGVVGDSMQESAEHHAGKVNQEIEENADLPDGEVSIGFDVEDTFAYERMQKQAAQDMVTVSDTIKTQVRNTLLNVADDGGNVTDATRELREKVDELSDSHARLVARTETMQASRSGSQALAESSDLIAGKEWNATDDSRTRPWHDAMDGVVVEKEEDFVVPAGWSGDPHYQPDSYPKSAYTVGEDQPFNCRCSQDPVLREDMPEDAKALREFDGIKVMPDVTERQFEVWSEHADAGEPFDAMWKRLRENNSRSELVAKTGVSDPTIDSWDE